MARNSDVEPVRSDCSSLAYLQDIILIVGLQTIGNSAISIDRRQGGNWSSKDHGSPQTTNRHGTRGCCDSAVRLFFVERAQEGTHLLKGKVASKRRESRSLKHLQ